MRRDAEIYTNMMILQQQRAQLAAQSEAQRRWLESDEPAVDLTGATVCIHCGEPAGRCKCSPVLPDLGAADFPAVPGEVDHAGS